MEDFSPNTLGKPSNSLFFIAGKINTSLSIHEDLLVLSRQCRNGNDPTEKTEKTAS